MENLVARVDLVDHAGQLLTGHGRNKRDVVCDKIVSDLLVDVHLGLPFISWALGKKAKCL
jgi:hypothetical protein